MAAGLNNGVYFSDAGAAADAYFQSLQNGTVRATFGYQNSSSSGKISFGALGTNDTVIFDATGGKYKGYNTNTAPAAGFIGERITGSATAGGLSNGTPANVISISLTAGVWDISSIAYILNSGASTSWQAGISTTSATFSGNAGIDYALVTASLASGAFTLVTPAVRATLSGTTTYYLVAQSTFSGGTSAVNGRITATRVA